MIVSAVAPTGGAYVVLDCAGVAASKITTSQGLGAADVFKVWGSLRASSAGGEVNDYPLGTVSGNGTLAPILALAWTRLLFQRAGGTGTGSLYVQGPSWGRSPPTENALPVTVKAWSAPMSFEGNGPAYVLSLDDAATSADVYQVWGTNDATARLPASAAGAALLGQLQGGGLSPPLLVVGYELVIVRCLSHGAASALVGVETLNDGFTDLSGGAAGSYLMNGGNAGAVVAGSNNAGASLVANGQKFISTTSPGSYVGQLYFAAGPAGFQFNSPGLLFQMLNGQFYAQAQYFKLGPWGGSPGQTGALQLLDMTVSSGIAVKAPDAVPSAYALVLPAAVATPGASLIDPAGDGNLAWSEVDTLRWAMAMSQTTVADTHQGLPPGYNATPLDDLGIGHVMAGDGVFNRLDVNLTGWDANTTQTATVTILKNGELAVSVAEVPTTGGVQTVSGALRSSIAYVEGDVFTATLTLSADLAGALTRVMVALS